MILTIAGPDYSELLGVGAGVQSYLITKRQMTVIQSDLFHVA